MRSERILLIRLGSFGDVVFTLPAVHLVRRTFSNAKLTFLVYKEYAPLLQGFPRMDAVLTLDRKRYRSLNPITIGAETFSLLRHTVRSRFQLVIDFQCFGETAWLTWLTGAPQRWGSVYRPSRRWAYTHPVLRNPQLHPVEYDLDVLGKAGGLIPQRIDNEFIPPESTIEEARQFFRDHQLQLGHPTLFIQPFTGGAHKTWPLENYLATARHWRQRGLQVLFGGGPGDLAPLEPVRQAGFGIAAGAPPLLSASLVKLSNIILGGDTGLLHLAMALNKRVVMLIPSVHPGACVPFGRPEWTITPMNGSPVASIKPEAVNRACAEALAELGLASDKG